MKASEFAGALVLGGDGIWIVIKPGRRLHAWDILHISDGKHGLAAGTSQLIENWKPYDIDYDAIIPGKITKVDRFLSVFYPVTLTTKSKRAHR